MFFLSVAPPFSSKVGSCAIPRERRRRRISEIQASLGDNRHLGGCQRNRPALNHLQELLLQASRSCGAAERPAGAAPGPAPQVPRKRFEDLLWVGSLTCSPNSQRSRKRGPKVIDVQLRSLLFLFSFSPFLFLFLLRQGPIKLPRLAANTRYCSLCSLESQCSVSRERQ